MLTVSVVVPTHQRREAVADVVNHVLADQDALELVVVVDGSTDGTIEWLESQRARHARLRPIYRQKGGVAAARQCGAEAASGDVVLFLDDDVVARPGLVAGHARHHEMMPRRLVAGYMPNPWAALPPGRRGIARVYRAAYEAACARYEQDPQAILLGFWAGNFSMRRDDCLKVRLDTPLLARDAREEDREFGLRCLRAGMSAVFDRQLRAEHLYQRDLAAFRSDCRRNGYFRPAIRRLHEDLLSADGGEGRGWPSPHERVGRSLPLALRHVWPFLARDPAFPVFSRLLALCFRVAVRARDLRFETLAVRALASLETQRGVLQGGVGP